MSAAAYKHFLELYKHVADTEKLAFTKTYLNQIKSDEEREQVSQLIDLTYEGLPPPAKKIIVLIHGIRTQGKWFSLLEDEIHKAGDFEVRHCKYGFFNALFFWVPIPYLFRTFPIKQVQNSINYITGNYPGAELCIVAHSNGTYILSKVIEKNPQYNIKKIILCGSIVSENYNWQSLKQQDKKLFINDCGTSDIWPILAKTSTFGYGASGRFGFNHTEITNRFHDCGHDGFFTAEFFSKYWIPFLVEGEVKKSEWDVKRHDENWISQILGVYPGFLLILSFIVIVITFTYITQ